MSFLVPKKLHGPSEARLVTPFRPLPRRTTPEESPRLQGHGFPPVGAQVPLCLKPGRFKRNQIHGHSHPGSWAGPGARGSSGLSSVSLCWSQCKHRPPLTASGSTARALLPEAGSALLPHLAARPAGSMGLDGWPTQCAPLSPRWRLASRPRVPWVMAGQPALCPVNHRPPSRPRPPSASDFQRCVVAGN